MISRLFKGGRKAPKLTREAAMGCVPVKNPEVEEERVGEGEVILSWPMRVRPWARGLGRLLGGGGGKPRQRRLQLDLLGTAVWELLDGRSPVREVVRRFAKRFELHPKEAEVAVSQFLRDLGKRGLIGLK